MSQEQGEYKTHKQTIFRTIKNADNPYVMMDRRPIENPILSWKAKGILAYLLSRPDNWIVRLGDLVKRSPDGVFAVRGAIKELAEAGHLSRKEIRDESGKFLRYELEVYELPFTSKPLIGFPQADNPQADNLMLNDTDINENDNKDAASPLLSAISESANKTVDGILELERQAKDRQVAGTGWRGRELLPPHYLPFADWWHAKTGLQMYGAKSKAKLDTEWLKACKELYENDVTIANLEEAWKAENWRPLTKLSQLVATAKAVQVAPNPFHQSEIEGKKKIRFENGRLINA